MTLSTAEATEEKQSPLTTGEDGPYHPRGPEWGSGRWKLTSLLSRSWGGHGISRLKSPSVCLSRHSLSPAVEDWVPQPGAALHHGSVRGRGRAPRPGGWMACPSRPICSRGWSGRKPSPGMNGALFAASLTPLEARPGTTEAVCDRHGNEPRALPLQRPGMLASRKGALAGDPLPRL